MRCPMFQVDAFTRQVFRGNPAAVVLLEEWLPDEILQAVAQENNLSETAFVVPLEEGYELRWFTPRTEVDLCGHATLATAWVLLEEGRVRGDRIRFATRQAGEVRVTRRADRLELDFPARPPATCDPIPELEAVLGRPPRELLAARDHLAVLDDEQEVRDLQPDLGLLERIPVFALCVTAPGRDADFVSRFFVPREGIPEDPVTGSAHCSLVPYWAGRLGKDRLHARQLSSRGGELWCELKGDRVAIAGQAVTFMRGEIELP